MKLADSTRSIRALSWLCILFLPMTYANALAKIYYVAPNGADGNDGSYSTPFKTIQKAADLVEPGDLVVVRDGLYTDQDGDNWIVKIRRSGTSDNWITFRSKNKWGAILDGENFKPHSGINIQASYIRIENFEIRNLRHGGIWSNDRQTHHVYLYGNNIHHIGQFDTNAGSGTLGRAGIFQGKGIHYFTYDSNLIHHIGRRPGSNPNIHHYVHDHGVYFNGEGTSSHTVFMNNLFYANEAGWHLMMDQNNDVHIVNNTFVGANPVRTGNGILIKKPATNVTVNNNIFYDMNTAATLIFKGSAAEFRNNLVYPTMPLSVGPETTLWPKSDNVGPPALAKDNIIGQNPQFVDVDNYILDIQAASPAIDAGYANGSPIRDLSGNSRPRDGGYDIGAYEYVNSTEDDTIPPSKPKNLRLFIISN